MSSSSSKPKSKLTTPAGEAADQDVVLELETDITVDVSQSVPQGDRSPVLENHAGVSHFGPNDNVASTSGAGGVVESAIENEVQSIPVFEGQGLNEIGSAKQKEDTYDEEFDYAFEGGKREGEFHKQVFQPKAIPVRLLSDVRQQPLHSVIEEEHEDQDDLEGEQELSTNTTGQQLPNYVTNSWATFPASNSQIYSYDNPPSNLQDNDTGVALTGEGTTLPSAQVLRLVNDQQGPPLSASTPWSQSAVTSATALPSQSFNSGTRIEDLVNKEAVPSDTSESTKSQPPSSREPAAKQEQDEWDRANQQRLQEATQSSTQEPAHTVSSVPGQAVMPAISYHEALVHFMSCDISSIKDEVLQSLPAEASAFSVMLCMAPPSLKGALKDQQVQLLSLAKIPLKDHDPMHIKLLQSIYTAYTGKYTTSRFGSHWADIGFQGTDPATDLRSCGMLGLLQLYYLFHHDRDNAHNLYQLSRSDVQEFPLAVVSLNITKWTIQAIRQGLLSKDANKAGSLTEVSARFYVGTFYEFYLKWMQGKTMRDSGYVLKELELLCKKKAAAMLKRAQTKLPNYG